MMSRREIQKPTVILPMIDATNDDVMFLTCLISFVA